MKEQYYIQLIAKRLKTIMCSPKDYFKIDQSFLGELCEEAFIEGYKTIFSLFNNIYNDIYNTPEKFDYPLLDVTRYDRFDKKVVTISIMPIFNFIYSLMISAELKNNQAFIEAKKLKKNLTFFKINKLQTQLGYLQNYGFVFQGWDGKVNLNNLDNFIVEFPDHPQMLTVLKAAAEKTRIVQGQSAKKKLVTDFYVMNYHLFEDNKEKVAPYIDEDYKVFVGEEQFAFIKAFQTFMETKGFSVVWDGMLHIRFISPKGKENKEIYICYADYKWGLERDNKLLLRIMFHHITRFQHLIETAPMHIKKVFTNTHCKHCNVKTGEDANKPCKFRVCYTLDGKEYEECIWEAFYFSDFKEDDIVHIAQYYDLEYSKKKS